MPSRLVAFAALAVLLAGCGAAQETSSGRYSGEEKQVARIVDDLQAAGQAADGDKICTRILAKPLADRLAAGGRSCAQEVEDAIADADEFTFEVLDVTVAGQSATARVKEGSGRGRTLGLVRDGKDWRVQELATG
jgi:hypothetical protein